VINLGLSCDQYRSSSQHATWLTYRLQQEQRYARLDAIARSVHWRNVALFFGGRVGRNFSGEGPGIVDVCRAIDRDGVDRLIQRGSWLAIELAADRALGPNRRGQRSLVECGLQVLERELTPGRIRVLIDLLDRLPDEDLRDHVVPIIRERVKVLDASRLKPLATVADALDVQDLVSEAVEKMLAHGIDGKGLSIVFRLQSGPLLRRPPKS